MEPGQEYLYEEDLEVFPPTGIDLYKIILTPEIIDLNRIIETRGASSRGKINNHPLEVLFSQSFLEEGIRGDKTINIPGGSVGLQTVIFEIID